MSWRHRIAWGISFGLLVIVVAFFILYAMVPQPLRQICLAPLAVFLHRVKGAKWSVVHYRLVGLDERIFQALFERTFCGCLKFSFPLTEFFVGWFTNFHRLILPPHDCLAPPPAKTSA